MEPKEFPAYLQSEQWKSWQKKTHDPDWAEHRYRDAKDRAMMHAVLEIENLLTKVAELEAALNLAEPWVTDAPLETRRKIATLAYRRASGVFPNPEGIKAIIPEEHDVV